MRPTIYRICIRGRVTERLGSALEGMRLEAGATNTEFTGEIRDQSQLYGLLDRVRDLGLELISVQPQHAVDPGVAGLSLTDVPYPRAADDG